MPRLTARPRPENTLVFDDGSADVTVCPANDTRVYLFVGFDPTTLRVRWLQRAPGTFDDPRGLRDHCGREGLWRSFLDKDHRYLLDRFNPHTLVELVEVVDDHAPGAIEATP